MTLFDPGYPSSSAAADPFYYRGHSLSYSSTSFPLLRHGRSPIIRSSVTNLLQSWHQDETPVVHEIHLSESASSVASSEAAASRAPSVAGSGAATPLGAPPGRGETDRVTLLERIRSAVARDTAYCMTPFGRRRLTNADHRAPRPPLSIVEDFLKRHATPSKVGTLLADSRKVIQSAVGARPDSTVYFCGPGPSDCVRQLLALMQLAPATRMSTPPLVVLSQFTPSEVCAAWAASCEVWTVPETAEGVPEIGALEEELSRNKRRLVVGCLSGVSRRTGMAAPVGDMTELLHRHGAVAVWDLTVCAPHMSHIWMGEKDGTEFGHLRAMDAVILAPSSYLGGQGCPSVLVVTQGLQLRQKMLSAEEKVAFEAEMWHDGEHTDAVAGIRAGLVLQLHGSLGPAITSHLQHAMLHKALMAWSDNAHIEVMGHATPASATQPLLAAFRIRVDPADGDAAETSADDDDDGAGVAGLVPEDDEDAAAVTFLTPALVATMAYDLFGLQLATHDGTRYTADGARSDDPAGAPRQTVVVEGGDTEGQVGWSTASFMFYMEDATADFIVAAVHALTKHGPTLAAMYKFDAAARRWLYSGPGEAAGAAAAFAGPETATPGQDSSRPPEDITSARSLSARSDVAPSTGRIPRILSETFAHGLVVAHADDDALTRPVKRSSSLVDYLDAVALVGLPPGDAVLDLSLASTVPDQCKTTEAPPPTREVSAD